MKMHKWIYIFTYEILTWSPSFSPEPDQEKQNVNQKHTGVSITTY